MSEHIKKLSKSPERNTFQTKRYRDRLIENENDNEAREILETYNRMFVEHQQLESTPEWQKDNMEYDLRTCDWILEKTRSSKIYAQNLYAAMCNRDFIKHDVVPILKNQYWSCSWRYAGGIIADMRQEGDYIDWYCSGIKYDDEITNFVPEGVVTDEIRQDLLKLGWIVVDSDN